VDKHGYHREGDENKYYRPDGKSYDLMRKAFEMKIYKNKSDKHISNRLNTQGFTKISGKDRVPANPKLLWKVWIDPFYYGMHTYGVNIVDLRDANVDFKPLISEEEYSILYERYQ